MINLLPPREKAELLGEETRKLTILIGITILGSLVCLSLILFFLETYIWSRVEFQKILLEEKQREFKNSGLEELQEKIKTINLSFWQLNTFYQQTPYFIEILEKISNVLPQELYLYRISLILLPASQTETNKCLQAALSGFVSYREALLKFKKNLEEEPKFGEISFPPTSWVKPEDIDFFVGFKVEL